MKYKHKPFAGRRPAKEVQGVSNLRLIPCAFCHEKFGSLSAAAEHERARHSKRLAKLMEQRP